MSFNIYGETRVVRKISFILTMSRMIATEDFIINIKKRKYKTVDWINIAQECYQWQTVVNMLTDINGHSFSTVNDCENLYFIQQRNSGS
jgi:hypothetical protein